MSDLNLTDLKALGEKATAADYLSAMAEGVRDDSVLHDLTRYDRRVWAERMEAAAAVIKQFATAIPALIERVERADRELEALRGRDV
jgi:flagellar biosynthesis regulator FlbT